MTKDVEHTWTVDSIEAGIARVEEDGERIISIPAYLLPSGVTEGQLLRVTRAPGADNRSVGFTIVVDAPATKEAMRKSKSIMAEAMDESTKRDPGGNVAL
jgi:hypothetical protein